MTAARRVIRIGARSSPLSVAQVELVSGLLAERGWDAEFVPITTRGDVDQRDLVQIGGTGVFAAAVRNAVLRGSVDLAVHSAKDLPTAEVAGLTIAAYPPREDVRDALVGLRLDSLGDGVRVGTGSPRRAVQLQAWAGSRGLRLEIVPIRGNVGTRLALIGDRVDVVVLAAAGLRRLGMLPHRETTASLKVNNHPADLLPTEVLVPAPAQGALALEVRSDDSRFLNPVRELGDPATAAAVRAERAFLGRLEAGCLAPTGAVARLVPGCDTAADLTLTAVTGRTVLRGTDVDTAGALAQVTTTTEADVIGAAGRGSSQDPEALGIRLARQVLAELLGSDN